jgi:ketosteroid isomerase-like protein
MAISKRNWIAAALLVSAWQPLLIGHASAQATHETLPAPARAPAAVVDGFHAALASGDTQAALDFLADDALIFEGGAVERSKSEYAAHHLAADAAFSQAVPGVRHHRSGEAIGEIAWITSEGHTIGTYKDKPVDRLTTETMVLKRVGDSWKIVHIHWSSAARKK